MNTASQTTRLLLTFCKGLLLVIPVIAFAETTNISTDMQTANDYSSQGNKAKAMYYYQVVLSQDKNNAEALYAIAEIEHAKRQYNSAFIRLNKILDNDAYNAKALFLRGKIYYQQKNLQQALADLEKAEQVDEHNPDIHITLDYIYSAMGKTDKAQKSLENYKRLTAPRPLKGQQ